MRKLLNKINDRLNRVDQALLNLMEGYGLAFGPFQPAQEADLYQGRHRAKDISTMELVKAGQLAWS